jgi:hypothetical protein
VGINFFLLIKGEQLLLFIYFSYGSGAEVSHLQHHFQRVRRQMSLFQQKHLACHDIRSLLERIEINAAGKSIHVHIIQICSRWPVTLGDNIYNLPEHVVNLETHYTRLCQAKFDIG